MKRALYELRNKCNYLSRILIHLKGQSRIYTSIKHISQFSKQSLNVIYLSIYLHQKCV